MKTRLKSPAVYYSLFGLQLTTLLAILSLAHRPDVMLGGLLGGVPLIALGLNAGRANADIRHAAYQQLTQAGVMIALIILVAMLAAGWLINGLLVFLLAIQATRNLTLSTRRDLYFCLIVTLVCLLFAAAQSRSSGFLIYMAAYILTGGLTLAAVHQDERLQFAIGRGHFPGRWRRWTVIGGFSVLLAVLSLGLYFAVPRPPAAHIGAFPAGGGNYYDDQDWLDEATNQAGETQAESTIDSEPVDKSPRENNAKDRDSDESANSAPGYSGFGEQLDIDDPGRQGGGELFNGIVLYMQAPRPLYLRGKVFDSFDGRTWHRHHPGTEKLELQNGGIRFMEDTGLPVIQQTVNVVHDLPGYIYGAERVAAVRFPGSVIARDSDRGLQVPGRLQSGTTYSVRSVTADAAGRPASGAEPLPDPEDYLQLPEDLSERISLLAAEVMHGATDMAAAGRLEQYLRNEYDYSFSTVVSSQGRIPLDEFLFETRRGHCEYFATAMAIMLRTQNIPARLATGFSATTYNPLTGYYEIRALDAHAWVEAWFPEHGWVLFEPTAFYTLPQPPEDTSTGSQLSQYLDDLSRVWEYLPEADGEVRWSVLVSQAYQRITEFMQQLVFAIRHGAVLLAHWLWQFGPVLVFATAVTGLIWYYLRYPWFRMRSRQRVKCGMRTLSPQAFARLCYQELEALAGYFGCPRDPAWTVEEYIDRLREFDMHLVAPAGSIGNNFTRIRYALQPAAFEPDREVLYNDYLRASRITPPIPALPDLARFCCWWNR
ncbi:MAG: DUF3488 and transglutaminase-like domain-containing protein [Pseudomonadota bacterium]